MSTTKKIHISPYNPIWAQQFDTLKELLLAHISVPIVSLQHVGSTSVVGLAAKPVIDMDIIVKKDGQIMAQLIKDLEKLGYKHVGDLGISGREAFKRHDQYTPNIGTAIIRPIHHLYVCTENSIGLRNHLQLRNYLRTHPVAANAYGALKQKLAQQFPHDMDAYVTGKTAFITNILAQTGLTKRERQQISKENGVE